MLSHPETSIVVHQDSGSHSSHSQSDTIHLDSPVHHSSTVKDYNHWSWWHHNHWSWRHHNHWSWWHRLWIWPSYYSYSYPSVVVVQQPSVFFRDYGYNDPYYDSGAAYYGSNYYEPAEGVDYDSSPETLSSSISFYGSPSAITNDIPYVDQPLVYPAEPVVIRFWLPWSNRLFWQNLCSPYSYYHINYQWGRFRSFWGNDYWPNTFMGRMYLHFRL